MNGMFSSSIPILAWIFPLIFFFSFFRKCETGMFNDSGGAEGRRFLSATNGPKN